MSFMFSIFFSFILTTIALILPIHCLLIYRFIIWYHIMVHVCSLYFALEDVMLLVFAQQLCPFLMGSGNYLLIFDD